MSIWIILYVISVIVAYYYSYFEYKIRYKYLMRDWDEVGQDLVLSLFSPFMILCTFLVFTRPRLLNSKSKPPKWL